jgi:hypothetical protein
MLICLLSCMSSRVLQRDAGLLKWHPNCPAQRLTDDVNEHSNLVPDARRSWEEPVGYLVASRQA